MSDDRQHDDSDDREIFFTDPEVEGMLQAGGLDEVDRQVVIEQTDLQMVLITMRRQTGLTQAEVQRYYDIDQSQLSDLETGRVTRPRDSTLRRLAMAYAEHIKGAEAEWLFLRLVEARDRRTDWNAIRESYDESQVRLRINLYPPEIRKAIWRMVSRLLDEQDIVIRVIRKSGGE